MSQEDIDRLRAEEMELENAIKSLREKRKALEEEEKRIKELARPIEIRVVKFEIGEQEVTFHTSTVRTDFVDYATNLDHARFGGAGSFVVSRDGFLIMLGEYLASGLNMQKPDGGVVPINESIYAQFNLVFKDGTPDRETVNIFTRIIHNERTPDYIVDIDKKQYSVVLYNHAPANPFSGIPGTRWAVAADKTHDNVIVPLSEGWRLYERLMAVAPKYITQWSDEALATAIAQAEKRNKLLAILKCEDYDIDAMFMNGYTLRPFQRVGVAYAEAAEGRWMTWDEMGLGKTWQELAFVWRQILKRRAEKALDEKVRKYKALFVVPANLIINWKREILNLTGIHAHILSGRAPNNADIMAMMSGNPEIFIINYDALATRKVIEPYITKHTDGRDVLHKEEEVWPWVDLFNQMGFSFIGFDEGHYLKNSESLRSQAGRMLKNSLHASIATGTPVVNRVDELWPLLNIIDPDTFPYEQTFTTQYGDGKYARNVDQLREVLKFIAIRRLKKDVVKDLPPINEIVKYFELPPKARKLYDKVLAGVYTIMADWDPSQAGSQMKITSMLAQIMRLKQIASIAKIDFVADLAVEQYDSAPEDEVNNKVIIFTQFVPVANAIARRLGAEALCLTGQVEAGTARTQIEDQFQNDPNIHFLVCTKGVAQEGLNLTRAGYVIKADLFWTPKDHDQCIGRAYGRLSNLHGANVTYCVADDTIEEWIQEIIHTKRALIGQVVDGRVVTGDESVAGELLARMKEAMGEARRNLKKE